VFRDPVNTAFSPHQSGCPAHCGAHGVSRFSEKNHSVALATETPGQQNRHERSGQTRASAGVHGVRHSPSKRKTNPGNTEDGRPHLKGATSPSSMGGISLKISYWGARQAESNVRVAVSAPQTAAPAAPKARKLRRFMRKNSCRALSQAGCDPPHKPILPRKIVMDALGTQYTAPARRSRST
jgi:hypothetical protein